MLSFAIASIANGWHQPLTLESSSHSVVNTFRLPPVGLQFLVSVTLMANEALSALLHNSRTIHGSYRHFAHVSSLALTSINVQMVGCSLKFEETFCFPFLYFSTR